jgi:CheY-like chemotaxis protein
MNLVINARDAMPDGGVIGVSSRNEHVGRDNELGLALGDYVVVTVEDSGAGIPPEIIGQVMEPFFTTKDIGKGTGLGLSMVYGFAEQSGGTMRIHSRVGEGTRVEIWLPRAPDMVDVDEVPNVRELAKIEPSAGLRILLADDHVGVRATTAALLEDLGHSVVEASDGPTLLSLLESGPTDFDLIISDYAMPLVSGTDVIQTARILCPQMPCILITGYADTQSIGRKPDDVQILAKPFNPQQLCDAIRRAAGPRALAAE